MADDVVLNTGSGGDTIAADDISGVKYQRVKPVHGVADSLPTDTSATDPLPVDVRELGGTAITTGAGSTDAGVIRVSVATDCPSQTIDATSLPLPNGAATAANQLPDGHAVTVDNASGASAVNIQDGGNVISVDDGGSTISVDDGAGSLTVDGTVTANAGTGTRDVQGNVAHDAADSGNPVGVGFNAVEHDADPPQVSADSDRVRGIATPQGIQWVLGGHPNLISREYRATTAQTNDDMLGAVAAGSHVVVTSLSVMVDAATTVDVGVRIGFGATTVPTEPADGAGVNGMVLSHPGIAAGSGVVLGTGAGVIGIGGDGEELRITSEVPTTGSLKAIITYYVSTL